MSGAWLARLRSALPRNSLLGILCGLAVALIWSGWAVPTRLAMTTSLAPEDVTMLRFGVSALLLWPVLLLHRPRLRQLGFAKTGIMLAGAGVPFMMCASVGMRFAPASHVASLMIGAMPIFVALLSAAFYGERFGRAQLWGFVTVIAGAVCIGGHALLSSQGQGQWRGDLLFVCGGLLFASYTVVQRRSGMSAWQATALVNVGSALLFAPVYFVLLRPGIWTAPLLDVLYQVLAQGIFVAILAMFFMPKQCAGWARRVRPSSAPWCRRWPLSWPCLCWENSPMP